MTDSIFHKLVKLVHLNFMQFCGIWVQLFKCLLKEAGKTNLPKAYTRKIKVFFLYIIKPRHPDRKGTLYRLTSFHSKLSNLHKEKTAHIPISIYHSVLENVTALQFCKLMEH